MKKISLIVACISSLFTLAQSTGDFYIQNYTPHYIEFYLTKSNLTDPATNCSPTLEARSPTNGLLQLSYSPSPGVTSTDALYTANVNNTFATSPSFPTTPVVGSWIVNSNYASPYYSPSPILNTFSNVTTYHGIKFGVQDVSGVNIGGYYFMGEGCNLPTITTDLTYDPAAVIEGSYFSFGGAKWVVLY